jgi:hypothetical protein
MAVQLSTAVRNAMGDIIESTIGASPTLEIRTGAPPATPATADSGTLLASLALPADWMTAAAGGVKNINGAWSDPAADGTGVAGHYRIKQGATCHFQGTVTISGGGGDMTLDNNNIAVGQAVSVSTFTLTLGNA